MARSQTLFALLALCVFFFQLTNANAETTARARKSKTVIETTTSDAEGETVEDVDKALGSSSNTDEPKEKEITAKFGSKISSGMVGCKTEEASKSVVNGLKEDCKAWVKDKRAELKGKYLTSSCEESCDDCGMSLQRCSVNGLIRYTVKEVK